MDPSSSDSFVHDSEPLLFVAIGLLLADNVHAMRLVRVVTRMQAERRRRLDALAAA